MKKYFMILIIFIMLCSLFSHIVEENKRTNILLLNSYSYDQKWTRNITESVRHSLAQYENIQLIVEFMDTKRHFSDDYYAQLVSTYSLKYKKTSIDLIITSDDNAINFIMKYRDKLFPKVPVVFCGVNNIDLPKHEQFHNMTGALEIPGFEETISLALKMHPESEYIYLVNESNTSGDADRRLLLNVLKKFSDRVEPIWIEDYTPDQIRAKFQNINKNGIVLLLSYFPNKNQGVFNISEGARYLSETTDLPIYSMWEYFLGEGIVGGMLTSGTYQGETAAKMALRILHGEKPESIPEVSYSANRYMFDYDYLKKFNIDFSSLPQNSIIINEPSSMLQKYRNQLIIAGLIIIFLLLVVLFLVKNIQKRHKVEKDLSESEEKYRSIIENMQDVYFRTDTDGKLIMLSPSAKTLLRYPSLDELLNRDIFNDLFIESQSKEELFTELKEKKQIKNREIALIRKDKSSVSVLISYAMLYNSNQDIIGIEGILHDISERKSAERAVIDSRNELHEIIDASPIGIGVTDQNGNILLINQKFTEMFGYTLRDIPTLTDWRLSAYPDENYRKEVLESWDKEVMKAVKNQTQTPYREFNVTCKDGYSIIAEIALKPGQNIRIITFIDITKRKKNERELRKAQKLEGLSTIAGGIAHDFNNMLTAVFGNVELAKLRLPEGHDSHTDLEMAHKALEATKKLTSQLLTFAKGGDPILERVNMSELVKETTAFNLRGSSVKPHFKLQNDLWFVNADKGQIGQVLANLTINAKQAMRNGGNLYIEAINIPADVSKSSYGLDSSFVRILIRDEGEGIPFDILDKIFDPYFTTKESGNGLGLSVVHSIIIKHNGMINVDSTKNEGTTFSILLPAHPDSTRPEIEKLTDKGNRDKVSDNLKVLLMDDDEMIRVVGSKMIESCGHSVKTVNNGEEAIREYKSCYGSEPYDLVVMDLTVPGNIGGKDAVKKLLEINPEVKTIVSSGYSSDPVMANYKGYGFTGKLSKPFEISELDREIQRVMIINTEQ